MPHRAGHFDRVGGGISGLRITDGQCASSGGAVDREVAACAEHCRAFFPNEGEGAIARSSSGEGRGGALDDNLVSQRSGGRSGTRFKRADVAAIAAGSVGDEGVIHGPHGTALIGRDRGAGRWIGGGAAFINRRAAGLQSVSESRTAVITEHVKQRINRRAGSADLVAGRRRNGRARLITNQVIALELSVPKTSGPVGAVFLAMIVFLALTIKATKMKTPPPWLVLVLLLPPLAVAALPVIVSLVSRTIPATMLARPPPEALLQRNCRRSR